MASNSDVNRISVGRQYQVMDETNYLDISRRIVRIEQSLFGHLDEFNAPCIPPVGSSIKWRNGITGVPATLPGCWQKCDGSAITDIYSPMYGQNTPVASGSGYWEILRIK